MTAADIAGQPSPVKESTLLARHPWQHDSRTELWVLVAYFASVIAVTDALNIRPGVEMMTLVVVIPAVAITRDFLGFVRDWWFLLLGLVMWNLSGPIAAQSPFPSHLDFMLNMDRALALGHQPVVEVQRLLAPKTGLDALDWVTSGIYNLHVPEPYIAGYMLWRINRAVYLQFAAAALILLVIGFISFVVFPAVPPWMASTWFHRIPYVVNRFGPVIHSHPLPFRGSPVFATFKLSGDAIAAFPSEHAAFPVLELFAFARAAGKRAAVGFSIWVLLVLFTIVYLGEHWITDALAGYTYAVAIWVVISLVCRSPALPESRTRIR